MGRVNNIPSALSNRPPWPGKKVPVSFILAFLFKNEIAKSPNCEINDNIIVINTVWSFAAWPYYYK